MNKPYVAWIDPGTVFDPVTHKVEDLVPIKIVRTLEEGQFPTCTLVVKGPQVALLTPPRKTWIMISEDVDGVPTFFFTGRLVALPSDFAHEMVTLKFIAEPPDYTTQQHTVGQTLKTDPNKYDPLMIDAAKRDDPNAILEAYSSRWHISLDLVVSVSDVLTGEDGVEVLSEDEITYADLDSNIGDSIPIMQVNVDAGVPWSQANTGTISFGPYRFDTYSGPALISAWPQPGSSVGGGWTVDASSAVDLNGNDQMFMANFAFNYQNRATTHRFGDTMSVSSSASFPVGGVVGMSAKFNESVQIGQISEDPDFVDIQPAFDKYNTFYAFLSAVVCTLRIRYQAGTDRTERVRFSLISDLQSIVTANAPGAPLPSTDIQQDGADVALPIQIVNSLTGAAMTPEPPPITDPKSNFYFPTIRGQRTIAYLINLARAILRAAARCVEVTFACTWERGLALSCRKNAQINERRVGFASGKLTKIVHTWDGPSGTKTCVATMGCAIGRGGFALTSEGQGVYAAPGYMAPGYQYMENNFVQIGTLPDVTFTVPPAFSDTGLKFPLTPDQVVLGLTVDNTDAYNIGDVVRAAVAAAIATASGSNPTLEEQRQAAQAAKAAASAPAPDLGAWFRMQLLSVDKQNFGAIYNLTVSNLAIEMGINLGEGPLAGLGVGAVTPPPTSGPITPSAPSIGSVDSIP